MSKDKPKLGPPFKADEDRRDSVVYLKVTSGEKRLIDQAGQPEPTRWARDILLAAARRRLK